MDNPVSRAEFHQETDKIYDKLNKHDRQITVLETLVENLKDLPSALNNLEKTMALMGQNLEILNGKVDSVLSKASEIDEHDQKQDKAISKLDNKSKVDILDFVKENWWKLCIGIAAAVLLFDKIATRV